MDVKMLPAHVEAHTLVQCGIGVHVSSLLSSSSSYKPLQYIVLIAYHNIINRMHAVVVCDCVAYMYLTYGDRQEDGPTNQP